MESARRIKIKEGLSSFYLPYYESLCELLDDKWQPYMGYRSINEQNALYAQGRLTPGPIVTHAKGPESAHCYGCATDWTIFDGPNPMWLNDENPLWKEFDAMVEKAGLRSGELFADPGHVELKISVSYHQEIASFYEVGGMEAAMKRIEETMIK